MTWTDRSAPYLPTPAEMEARLNRHAMAPGRVPVLDLGGNHMASVRSRARVRGSESRRSSLASELRRGLTLGAVLITALVAIGLAFS